MVVSATPFTELIAHKPSSKYSLFYKSADDSSLWQLIGLIISFE